MTTGAPAARTKTEAKSPSKNWDLGREAGTVVAIRTGAAIHRFFGRRVFSALLWLPAFYFYFRNATVRNASRDFLATIARLPEGRAALGMDGAQTAELPQKTPGRMLCIRHLREFALQLLDRLVTWADKGEGIEVAYSGEDRLVRAMDSGRGALIVAGHMGSFDVMRLLATRYDLTVNVVMYTENAQQINRFFEELDPQSRARVIPVDPASTRTAFEMRACLARGEAVAILGDRLRPGSRERVLPHAFLGRPAAFPAGPFLLSAVLGCPLLMASCRRTGDGAYHVDFRELSPGERAPRNEQCKCASEFLSTFVTYLEADCLRTPFQWFNFFDFWGAGRSALAERDDA